MQRRFWASFISAVAGGIYVDTNAAGLFPWSETVPLIVIFGWEVHPSCCRLTSYPD